MTTAEEPLPPTTALDALFARHRWLGPALVAVVFVAMTMWSWGKWLDPLIDFGRELYVPWQLTEGRVLYRDLAYFNGPLSPYWNAALFSVFGVGLSTLVWANLAILSGVTFLLYRWIVAIGGRTAATFGCVVFLTHCCFGQKIWVANFNWICPYSHEMTHGFALALVALTASAKWADNGQRLWLAVTGLCLGLCFLTKPEILLAAGLAIGCGLGATWLRTRPPLRSLGRDVGTLAATAALPGVIAFALLATTLPIADAFDGTLGGWLHLGNAQLTGLRYYKEGLGTDDIAGSLGKIAGFGGAYAVVFGGTAALLLALRSRTRAAAWLATLPAAAALGWATYKVFVTVALEYADSSTGYQNAYRPMIVVVAAVALIASVAWLRQPNAAPSKRLTLVFAVFAASLLAKMLLHVRVHHYGFTLTVPGLLLATSGLVHWIPAMLARARACAAPFQAVAIAALALSVAFQLRTDHYFYEPKDQVIASGRDRFYGNRAGRGQMVGDYLLEIGRQTAGQPFLVLPEGVTLNYLLRRPSPTKHFNFMPPEFAMFGEEPMLADLRASPPPFIVVVHRSTKEYGLPLFGRNYAQKIWGWVYDNYRVAYRVGPEPLHPDRLRDSHMGIWTLQHDPK